MESKSIEMDIVGRVMALEQKLRGLQGRVSALEIRLSSDSRDACPLDPLDHTEFISGECAHTVPDLSALEGRIAAIESAVHDKPLMSASIGKKNFALDLTGIVVGMSLLVIGVLLSTDSFDILRNPLLAFGAGIVVLACVLVKIIK